MPYIRIAVVMVLIVAPIVWAVIAFFPPTYQAVKETLVPTIRNHLWPPPPAVATILPMTGPSAKFGQEANRAIEFVQKESTNPLPFSLQILDSQGNPKEFAKLASQIKPQPNVKIAFTAGGATVGSSIFAQASQLPVLDVLSIAPTNLLYHTNLLRFNSRTDTQSSLFAQFARTVLNRTNALCIAYYSTDSAVQFASSIKQLGGAATAQFTSHPFDVIQEVRAVLHDPSRKGVDCVYLDTPVLGDSYIKNLSSETTSKTVLLVPLGLNSVAAFDNTSVITIAPAWQISTNCEELSRFRLSYQKTFAEEPSPAATLTYDALQLITQCWPSMFTNTQHLFALLTAKTNFQSITGFKGFDTNGVAKRDYVVVQYHTNGTRTILPAN